jgi:hypothetical protein
MTPCSTVSAAARRDVGSHGAGPSAFRAARQRLAAARQNEVAPGTEAARWTTRRNRALHRRSSVDSPPSTNDGVRGAGSMMTSAGSSSSWGCGFAERDHPTQRRIGLHRARSGIRFLGDDVVDRDGSGRCP